MDDTERLLRRFEHRMSNVHRLDARAEILTAQAEDIDRQLAQPEHGRPLEDNDALRLEADDLRQRAAALTRDADGMQRRLCPPLPDLTQEIETWAARQERGWERDL